VPTYQYQCTECGEALEVQQSFTDDALTVCPHCQGRLRKVFNAVGVVFKGSGFYRNDSRQTSGDTPAKKSADAPATATPAAPAPAPASTSSKPTSTKQGTDAA